MSPSSMVALAITALLLLAAQPAFACAVCFDATSQARDAFFGTTILLSLMPLAMIGGLVYWIWRRAKAVDEDLPLVP